jgi:hypothetical protein
MTKRLKTQRPSGLVTTDYESALRSITEVIARARREVARTVNAVLKATYWEIGRRVVELEQGG